MSLTAEKEALRVALQARRRLLSEAEREAAAAALVTQWRQRFNTLDRAKTIAGFWPNRNEIDCRTLLAHLHARGHDLLLPVVVARDQPLIFRRWAPGDALERGNGAHVPLPSAAIAEPDFLIVPLTAFDRSGYRLGQGAGYYDRTLAGLRARRRIMAVGVAFAVQEVARVPFDLHDERLDGVLTEAGYIATGSGDE
jgi:5-formyltetrahydrofolate cyclo-ligase